MQAQRDPLESLSHPASLLWVLIAGECVAAILAMAPGYSANRWVYFGLASLGVQWVSLLTLASLMVLRKVLSGRHALLIACTALALMQVVTLAVTALVFWTLGDYLHLGDHHWRALAFQLSGVALLIAMLGMGALHNHLRLRQLAVRAKQAELDALTARVQPHFLFNTLNMAVALVHAKPQQAEQLLLDLSELFRAALGGPDDVHLADEIMLAKRYLDIESLRFGARLRVRWILPAPLPNILLPRLTLQPLIENAVHHGVEGTTDGGEITIAVIDSLGSVRIEVRNTLSNIANGRPNPGHGIGLPRYAAAWRRAAARPYRFKNPNSRFLRPSA